MCFWYGVYKLSIGAHLRIIITVNILFPVEHIIVGH
jgi:hypothetical protein